MRTKKYDKRIQARGNAIDIKRLEALMKLKESNSSALIRQLIRTECEKNNIKINK